MYFGPQTASKTAKNCTTASPHLTGGHYTTDLKFWVTFYLIMHRTIGLTGSIGPLTLTLTLVR